MSETRSLTPALSLLAAIALLLLPCPAILAQESLVILHLNDFHGQILPRERSSGALQGGARALAAAVEKARAELGNESVLLLDGGDWFQGTPEGNHAGGAAVVDFFSAIGVDATVVGNHDFDHGIDNLLQLVERAKFPVLGANVDDVSGAVSKALSPSRIIERGGIRIGLIGILTPDAPHIIMPGTGERLRVAPLAATVEKEIEFLRGQGAELIVVLSHSGVEAERRLAEEVAGIDIIIGGHSHTLVEKPWVSPKNGTVVAQAQAHASYLGRIEVRRNGGELTISGGVLPLAGRSETVGDRVEGIIAPVIARVSAEMDGVVGTSPVAMSRPARGVPRPLSSQLGSWISHQMALVGGVEIAVHNHGGIRASLPEGPVTERDLYQISPFGNQVVVCQVSGADLRAIARRSLVEGNRRLDAYQIEIGYRQSEDGPVLSTLSVAGEALDDERVYSLATSDYLAFGGDGWSQFDKIVPPVSTGVSVLEATRRGVAGGLDASRRYPPVYVPIAAGELKVAFAQGPDETPEVQQVAASGGGSFLDRARSALGLIVLVFICWLLSLDRSKVRWRTVLWGVGLQLLFGAGILLTDTGHDFTDGAKEFFKGILDYSKEGTGMVFGALADQSAGPWGMQFWIILLGTIIFVSAMMAVFYHIGLLQVVVWLIARVMQKTMKTSGPESLAAAANIFAGQTEAPLVIRPYLPTMTSSEVMALMTGGMATVAGSVFAAYVSIGIDAGHLLAASVMSAPASLAIAKLLVPETEREGDPTAAKLEINRTDANLLDAACRGTSEGLKLALNVIAMLIAFVAIVALLNAGLAWCTQHLSYWATAVGSWVFGVEAIDLVDAPRFNLKDLFGWIFYPFAWLLGVDLKDVPKVASLIGIKTVLNEFVAFGELTATEGLTERSRTLATYALCGFANFASVAIQIGGISALEPGLRPKLSSLGLRALLGGTIAALMTGCVAGLLL